MKKVIFVVLVSLLVSMVTYGENWVYDPMDGYLYVNPSLPGYFSGVGIGTNTPGEKLEIAGGGLLVSGTNQLIYLDPPGSRKWLVVEEEDFWGPEHFLTFKSSKDNGSTWKDGLAIKDNGSVCVQTFDQSSEQYCGLSITPNVSGGNVKIEALTLASKMIFDGILEIQFSTFVYVDSDLSVKGKITAKEVIVTQDGWSDFVFSGKHKLMPLDKLEKHIKVNKSLPGIPTEKEVLENGVSLGEMQAKLLEKVEELTLYVIELKKENEELKKTNKTLERRISALEK